MWFCFNSCSYEEFNSADEAKGQAEEVLEEYRGEACDGWSDDSMNISWGIVLQTVEVTEERPAQPDDNMSGEIQVFQKRELVDQGMGYDMAVLGIRSAGMTQLPAIVSESIEAAMKAGCFIDDDAIVSFVARRIREINAAKRADCKTEG